MSVQCETNQVLPTEEGNTALRIASIFVILLGSLLGALSPVWLARNVKVKVNNAFFFAAKYFGTGVILSTAWMHLLSPAEAILRDPCLVSILTDYDWAMVISLITVMAMLFIELMVSHFETTSQVDEQRAGKQIHDVGGGIGAPPVPQATIVAGSSHAEQWPDSVGTPITLPLERSSISFVAGGRGHLLHGDHVEGGSDGNFSVQVTAIAILEFGIVLHSIFIGLTLALSRNFIILFIVITFHQTFEGLGLGARLAIAPWPTPKRWIPVFLVLLYAVSTPAAVAVGIAIRTTYQPESPIALITNGVFDAISAGILIYTALVELLAHEFMFSPSMRRANLTTQLGAYSYVSCGVVVMAVLAKWV